MIDADGLNAFAGQLEPARRARRRRRSSPRTPASWAGCSSATPRRSPRTASPAAREAAAAAGAVVVLKGDDTIVTDGERVAVNAISAPALATAGTGDVLSGMTAALLARGLEPFAAACAAVLAHARAGRDAAAAGRRRRVGDRHRRDRLDPGGHASRRARSNNLAEDEDRRRDHGRRRAQRLPGRRRPRRDRPARQDRDGRDPGHRRRPQGGRDRQRVRPDPQRRGVRPAPAALPQHHGRDRLRRLDEGLRGAPRTRPSRPRSPS